MHQDQMYGPAEPLSWRDIEALPFYLAGALVAFALVYWLSDTGIALRTDAVKAMLVVGMLGVYQIWSDVASQ